MTQQFKFGDMVQHPEFGRGVVVAAFDHSIDVVFEKNRTVTRTICFAFLSELELIPHTAQSGWISVADRLPEIGQRVLAALDYGGSRTTYAEENFGDTHTIWKDGKKYEYRYTHWFPLPQDPKASE